MYNLRLQLFLFIIWAVLFIYLVHRMKVKRTNIRYLLPWLALDIIMIILTAAPGLVGRLSTFLGIEVPSNMLFLLGMIFVTTIIFTMSITISNLTMKVRELTQRLAIYEHDSIFDNN